MCSLMTQEMKHHLCVTDSEIFWDRITPTVLIANALLITISIIIIALTFEPNLDSFVKTANSLEAGGTLEKVHLCVLSCAIPLISDVFLDIFAMKQWRLWNAADIRITRVFLIGASIVPSMTYISFIYIGGDMRYLPISYNISTKVSLIVFMSTVLIQTCAVQVVPACSY